MTGELTLQMTGEPPVSVVAMSIGASMLVLVLALMLIFAWPRPWRLSVASSRTSPAKRWTRRAVLGWIPAMGGIGVLAASGSAAGTDTRSILECYAAAWRSGDLKAIAACYHESFTLHYFGNNALSGVHTGKARALDILRQFSIRTRRRLLAVTAIMAGADHGALIAREILMKGETPVEVERVFLYRIEDRLLAECWIYDPDQRLIDSIIG